MTMKARLLLVAALCSLVPAAAFSQALTSLASVRVQYVTRKNTVKPQGELKAQIDALDVQIAEAGGAGRNGELRRLFAKGMSLLNNRPWTDAVEYAHSIVLRTDRVVVDSSKPYSVRLEQIFAPSIALQRTVSAHVTLRKGVDDLAARLEADAKRVPESARAEMLFPIDRMKNVNRGRLELRTFDPDKDLAAAEAAAASARGGKDPFAGRTGDFKRHYLL